MKNINILAGLALMLTLLSGCEKWLEFDPHDEYAITEADYLKSASDYNAMAVSCYTPLQWLNQAVVIGDIASDNAVAGGENAADVLDLQKIDDYTTTANNGALEEIWIASYEGINRVNYLVQHKDKNIAGEVVDFAGKEALYGELYFLRAYYYFNLVKFFGNAVLFTDKKLGIAEFGTLKRTDKSEVYKQIEVDLKAAIEVLPATNTQQGRVTKYAAQALLGKAYLYQEKFTEAASMLNNLVGKFSLVPVFNNIFLFSGENGPESVFEVQYSNGSPYYNWKGITRGQGNYAVQQCGIRGLSGSDAMPYAAGWSTNLPTQDLASAYTTGDQRKDATVLDIEAYKTANPALDIIYTVAPYKNTGLYNKKYLPIKGQTSGQIELNYENNQRIIRYADVLLMAAEAYNRATPANDAKAQQYLNEVRKRAFGDDLHAITATGISLTQAIWDERRLELAMEGDRFFDLVRTKQTSKIKGFMSGKNEIFPVPQREIDISGIEQNPGY